MTLQAATSPCVRMQFIRTDCLIRVPELRRRTGNNDFCRNGIVLRWFGVNMARTPRIKGLPLAESRYPFREPRPGYNRSDFELLLRKPFVEEKRMSQRYDREDGLDTSWASVVFGWLATLGASLILSGIVGAVLGAIFAVLGFRGGRDHNPRGALSNRLSVFSHGRLRRRAHGGLLRY
jgi:hypothetical protein